VVAYVKGSGPEVQVPPNPRNTSHVVGRPIPPPKRPGTVRWLEPKDRKNSQQESTARLKEALARRKGRGVRTPGDLALGNGGGKTKGWETSANSKRAASPSRKRNKNKTEDGRYRGGRRQNPRAAKEKSEGRQRVRKNRRQVARQRAGAHAGGGGAGGKKRRGGGGGAAVLATKKPRGGTKKEKGSGGAVELLGSRTWKSRLAGLWDWQ